MDCKQIEILIDLYLDEQLDESSRHNVDRHLLACSECASLARQLEQTRGFLMAAYPREAARPAFRERLAARLEDELADVLTPSAASDAFQPPLPFLTSSTAGAE